MEPKNIRLKPEAVKKNIGVFAKRLKEVMKITEVCYFLNGGFTFVDEKENVISIKENSDCTIYIEGSASEVCCEKFRAKYSDCFKMRKYSCIKECDYNQNPDRREEKPPRYHFEKVIRYYGESDHVFKMLKELMQ